MNSGSIEKSGLSLWGHFWGYLQKSYLIITYNSNSYIDNVIDTASRFLIIVAGLVVGAILAHATSSSSLSEVRLTALKLLKTPHT